MVVGLSLQDCLSREERDLKRILLVYLSVSATGWLVTFCYQFYPSLFVRLNVVLPALFRLAVYLLLPDRPFPHEAGRAGGIPASPLSRTRAAGAGDVGLVVLRAFDVRLEIVRGKAEVIPQGTSGIPAFLPSSPC